MNAPKHLLVLALLAGNVFFAQAQSLKNITVDIAKPTVEIKPNMWGIFFEDINLAADGGLYAELVKNRSFEFTSPLMGWKEQKKGSVGGSILVLNRGTKNENNPRYIRVKNAVSGKYGITNDGFRGMGIQKNKRYDFSVWAKPVNNARVALHIELVNAKGEVLGGTTLYPGNTKWKQYSGSFISTDTAQKAQLNIWFEGKGSIDLDMISLFPQDTWRNRPGGLRTDLVQLLADLKPGFVRFPGGCIVEGRDLANRYQWKKTVGNIEDRQLIINRWNTEFANRSTPDYFQSFGLGFYEYFLLSEDIGAAPLPILNCGMACQFNTSEVVPTDQLDPYIQDALDLIEFANGSIKTKWGKLRAGMGHPAPFNLKMIGVGNEQWGPQYIERFTYFAKAIKQKYPAIQLVNSVGPNPDGELFNFLNDTLRKMHADILDEHYYKSPEWFLQNAKRYDNYDRNGPKIFAGEYAAHSVGIPNGKTKNNWRSALAEAAFMTGLERNADIVNMASYAPLFAHVDGWQWTPDLIWFDNLQSYGTPNYYVQKLFSTNRGSQVVPITMNNEVLAGKDSLYASACIDKATNELIIKIANTIGAEQPVSFNLEGLNTINSKGIQTVIRSDDMNGVNSFEKPMSIVPVTKVADVTNKILSTNLSPNSFTVIRLKL
ncbi:MAG: alpha-L-arabinofuranosidase C-terminal domain-containing protein [Bacteroidota bacterium]